MADALGLDNLRDATDCEPNLIQKKTKHQTPKFST
jgi:hypothetical protein